MDVCADYGSIIGAVKAPLSILIWTSAHTFPALLVRSCSYVLWGPHLYHFSVIPVYWYWLNHVYDHTLYLLVNHARPIQTHHQQYYRIYVLST